MAKLDIEVEEPDVDEEDAGGELRGGVSALREVSISKRPRRRDVRGTPPSRTEGGRVGSSKVHNLPRGAPEEVRKYIEC